VDPLTDQVDPDLMTVEEVQAVLHVSAAQVHNLCRVNDLTKVPPPTGRKNHPARAAVITRESVDRLLWDRQLSAVSVMAKDESRIAPVVSGSTGADRNDVRWLKRQLDEVQAELHRERQRRRELVHVIKALAAQLDGEPEVALDQIAASEAEVRNGSHSEEVDSPFA